MKQAIIFDMDGVLIQSEEFYFKRRMAFFDKINIEPGSCNFNDFLGASNQRIWELLVPDNQNRRQKLIVKYQRYLLTHKINYQKYLVPEVPYTLECLKQRGYQLVLASAGEVNEIQQMLDECGIKSYFVQVISGETLVHNKPHPEIYLTALAKLNLPSSACIAIEDSPTGIAAAKKADIETWALKPANYTLDQSKADAILPDFSTILTWLDPEA